MHTTHADLEINILRPHPESCQVELRFTNPNSKTEIDPVRTAFPLNLKELLPLALDSAGYGKALSDQLFQKPEGSDFYQKIKTVTKTTDLILRVRLRIDSTALDLHALRWELLVDPLTGTPLATSERILFSRFMTSQDNRLVQLRPKAELRALVAVANPINLAEDYPKLKLAPVDLDGEIQRARTALNGITIIELGQEQPLTLSRLDQNLRKDFDILYLVCHGMLQSDSGPMLCLQNEDGNVSWESGNELALRISEMTQPPRLVVLASCQSAGTGQISHDKNTVQAALAPRLADAGVAAIIAMQGNISMKTVETMMPVFFKQLLKDGRIDRATAVARGTVRDRPDFWLPALFLRLKDGQLWKIESKKTTRPRLPYEPKLIEIPAGPFLMGTAPAPGIPAHETPQHEVVLPTYCISQAPITNGQYETFVSKKRYEEPKNWILRKPPPGSEKYPVTNVSWQDAVAYCAWLSEQTKQIYRLPSEAEWEKAARSTDGRLYPWGNDWQEGLLCNNDSDALTPVSAFPKGASPYGCLDMLGNVREWTSTIWGTSPTQTDFPYPFSQDGRDDLSPGSSTTYRIYRGGCFQDKPENLRCTVRYFSPENSKLNQRGFRVVMEEKE